MRRGASTRAARADDRPTRVTTSVSSADQPSRARASVTDESAGSASTSYP